MDMLAITLLKIQEKSSETESIPARKK